MQTCRDCGSRLTNCPICRERITNRLRVFTGWLLVLQKTWPLNKFSFAYNFQCLLVGFIKSKRESQHVSYGREYNLEVKPSIKLLERKLCTLTNVGLEVCVHGFAWIWVGKGLCKDLFHVNCVLNCLYQELYLYI